ncbi:MAG: SsrA-binding protein SmpB [Syntrophales bacterium]|nr:SsrA-binding protein SmpB [Syntrophales bacterium]MDD5642945.1 SsrA-binding protein SmpB [Syntrophales bacterium]
MKNEKDENLKIICRNRKAYFDYHIDAFYEAGMVLQGTEVKALREGRANINDAYARFRNGEIFLYNAHISHYSHAAEDSHAPERPRKLLLHRWEMRRLLGKLQERGYTLIPLRLYFRNEHAKVELGLAKGKKKVDKRESIRRREEQREIERARKRRK